MAVDSIGNVHGKQLEAEAGRIPLNLLIEILSRSPATSLLRFRRACKLWRSTINDPDFIDTHLERARNAPSILLFFPNTTRGGRYCISILDAWAPKRHSSFANCRASLRLYLNESCNGLLCISGDDGQIELRNLATGEFLFPPEPENRNAPTAAGGAYLGFHPVTKEYKVIRFLPKGKRSTRCEVYTVGTTSWRRIPSIFYYPTFRAAAVKGAMYWAAYPLNHGRKGGEKDLPHIISFDLKDERFTRIPPPNFEEIYGREHYEIARDLVELQGCVCICMWIFPEARSVPPMGSERRMDIWMLNDDQSTKHEWTRKHSVIYSRWEGRSPIPSPVIIHNDKILVHEGSYLGGDDDDYKGLEGRLRYHCLKSGRCEKVYCDGRDFTPFVHVESLVPLRMR